MPHAEPAIRPMKLALDFRVAHRDIVAASRPDYGNGPTDPVSPDALDEHESPASRGQWIVLLALLSAALLAWGWLMFLGHHLHVPPIEAASTAGMTGDVGHPIEALPYFGSAFVMWVLMMVAMMVPSALPMIMVYARFKQRTAPGRSTVPVVIFAGCYILIWVAFAGVAALVQTGLVVSGAIGRASLGFGNDKLAAFLLAMTALYQLSMLKHVCLSQCRSPLSFLTRYWRPGRGSAIRLGLIHGTFCLGCCWLLMLLLFVGGVMNLLWVAILALVVVAEKLAPAQFHVEKVVAAACAFGALYLLLM